MERFVNRYLAIPSALGLLLGIIGVAIDNRVVVLVGLVVMTPFFVFTALLFVFVVPYAIWVEIRHRPKQRRGGSGADGP